MAQKYALYKLEKVVGKKEYVPRLISSRGVSYSEAKRHLDMEYEDFPDGPLWYNDKIEDFVTYTLGERIMYVPNDSLVEIDGAWEMVCHGVYRRYPIYYIDVYPNPYSYYKLHVYKFRGIKLEGIE